MTPVNSAQTEGEARSMVPPVNTCHNLMENLGMPDHIRRHSVMVEQAAALIGRAHIENGAELSMKRIRAGALLHDIAKAECIETGGDHAARGREMCLEHSFGEIAEIVGEHVRLQGFIREGPVLEKEIVYYADKRVNHDRIVSLDERLEDLIARYGRGREDLIGRIEENFALCRDLERKLFRDLEFGPESLSRIAPGASARPPGP